MTCVGISMGAYTQGQNNWALGYTYPSVDKVAPYCFQNDLKTLARSSLCSLSSPHIHNVFNVCAPTDQNLS